jgi:acyl-CoA synthetase (AMP-forming)/AMP-acid ligase II
VPGALRHRIERELTRDLWVHFGSTEYGLASIAMPGDHDRYPDGVGRSWGAEVIIVDPEGRRLPRGETGMIRVLSAGRAEGYLDDPAETERVFLPGGWFHSGDVGSITPDGHIVFGGRSDDMMILGTINIFPAEIESVASLFPGVAECAAFGYRTHAHGDIPMIAVVEAGAGAVDVAGLLAHCRDRLGLRAPRKVLIVESLPRNSGGKVVRRQLASAAVAP